MYHRDSSFCQSCTLLGRVNFAVPIVAYPYKKYIMLTQNFICAISLYGKRNLNCILLVLQSIYNLCFMHNFSFSLFSFSFSYFIFWFYGTDLVKYFAMLFVIILLYISTYLLKRLFQQYLFQIALLHMCINSIFLS